MTWEEVEQPLRHSTWTDQEGTTWRRRGVEASPMRVEHLLREARTRVVRAAADGSRELPRAEWADYWAKVKPYVTGKVRQVSGENTNDHFDCRVGELRDGQRVLLVFEESC